MCRKSGYFVFRRNVLALSRTVIAMPWMFLLSSEESDKKINVHANLVYYKVLNVNHQRITRAFGFLHEIPHKYGLRAQVLFSVWTLVYSNCGILRGYEPPSRKHLYASQFYFTFFCSVFLKRCCILSSWIMLQLRRVVWFKFVEFLWEMALSLSVPGHLCKATEVFSRRMQLGHCSVVPDWSYR